MERERDRERGGGRGWGLGFAECAVIKQHCVRLFAFKRQL